MLCYVFLCVFFCGGGFLGWYMYVKGALGLVRCVVLVKIGWYWVLWVCCVVFVWGGEGGGVLGWVGWGWIWVGLGGC